MTNDDLDTLFRALFETVEGEDGRWQVALDPVRIICLTDTRNNRMRFMAPIKETEEMGAEEMLRALNANFHTALDIKYAVSDGVMWSLFMHPLSELNEEQAKDALSQVYHGAVSYGGSYTSSDLSFPGTTPPRSSMN